MLEISVTLEELESGKPIKLPYPVNIVKIKLVDIFTNEDDHILIEN